MAHILAMRRNSPEGDLNPSRAYGEKWGLPPKLLPQRQRNFAGHPDKCPAEALLGIKRSGIRNARIIPPLSWRTSEEVVLFGAPSTTEGAPRRTRRLRHGLSSEHGTPVFLYVRKHSLREILPPDALRSRSQAVVRSAEGGRSYRCPAAFCELSAIVKGVTFLLRLTRSR